MWYYRRWIFENSVRSYSVLFNTLLLSLTISCLLSIDIKWIIMYWYSACICCKHKLELFTNFPKQYIYWMSFLLLLFSDWSPGFGAAHNQFVVRIHRSHSILFMDTCECGSSYWIDRLTRVSRESEDWN